MTEELPSLKELYDARKEPYDANESEVMMLPRSALTSLLDEQKSCLITPTTSFQARC